MKYVWNCVLSSATMLQVSKFTPVWFPQGPFCARQGQHLLQVLFLGWDDSHGSHTSVRKEMLTGDTPLPIWCGFTRIYILFILCLYIMFMYYVYTSWFIYVYNCLHMVHVFSLIGLFLLQFYIPLSQLEHCKIPRSMTDRNVIEERLCKRLL